MARLLTGDVPVLDAVMFLFYVDGEGTVPAMYSGAVILACAALLGLVARLERRVAGQFRHWVLLALAVGWVGLDELFAFHERSMEPVRRALGIDGGAFHYAWVVPAMVLLAALGLTLLGFLRRLPARTRRDFLIAGMIFVCGGLGVEMLSAAVATSSTSPDAHRTWPIVALATVEEALEMIGMALFLAALLRHVRDFHPASTVSLDFGPGPAAAGRPADTDVEGRGAARQRSRFQGRYTTSPGGPTRWCSTPSSSARR